METRQVFQFSQCPGEVISDGVVDPNGFASVNLSINFRVEVVKTRSEEGVHVEGPVDPSCKSLPMTKTKTCMWCCHPRTEFMDKAFTCILRQSKSQLVRIDIDPDDGESRAIKLFRTGMRDAKLIPES